MEFIKIAVIGVFVASTTLLQSFAADDINTINNGSLSNKSSQESTTHGCGCTCGCGKV